MKQIFAIPSIEGKLCSHFGRCRQFAIVESEDQKIKKVEYVDPPEHHPGVYPRFLASKGVNTIISGGLGMKAQALFEQNNIEVFVGVNSDSPEILVEQYLLDQLKDGKNICDH